MRVPINPGHHAITIVLGIEAGVDNPGHHHQNITTAHNMKEPEDPSLQNTHTTMKTTKRRCERHPLLAQFAEPPYPKDSNSPMINRNTMGPKSRDHGSQAVKILGGSKETAMQSLQLHLTGATRSWLGKLGRETIRSWDKLARQFTSNFNSTYKWPASTEKVKAYTQKHNESLRSYIQRWSIIKNFVVAVSNERAIDAFTIELRRGDLVKEMG
jgi:hypothetical protein